MKSFTIIEFNLGNDTILVAGGNDFMEFEFIGRKSNPIPPLPRVLIKPTLLLQNENRLMCIGGSWNRKCYILKNGEWKVHSLLQEERLGSAVVQMPKGIYVLHGICRNRQITELLPKNSTTWIKGPEFHFYSNGLKDFRAFATAHKRSNEEFVVHTENGIFKKFLNSSYSEYFSFPILNNFYGGQASVVFNSKLMITGGKTKWSKSREIEYSAKTILVDLDNSISKPAKYLGNLNIPRALHRMEIILMENQRKIIAIGGETTGGKPLDSIEIFNMKTNTWEISTLKLSLPRANFSSIVVPSNLSLNENRNT